MAKKKETYYQMPVPEVGEVVHFRYEDGDPPTPAIVLQVSDRTVDLFITRINGSQTLQDAVRAANDPELINPEVAKRGRWSFSRQQLLLRRLGELVEKEEDEPAEEPQETAAK